MLNALAFGLGFGAAVQAWRSWPPQAPVTADSLALVFCLGLVAAWLGGRSRRGAAAVAVATADATAVATNTVQVAFFAPGSREDMTTGSGLRVPSEAAPWMGTRSDDPGALLASLDQEEVRSILEESGENA